MNSINIDLTHLYNCGVMLTCGLCKYDHVTQHKAWLGWLPVDCFVKYHSLLTLFNHYIGEGVARNPAIWIGCTHIQMPSSSCYNTFCVKKSFGQKHFHHQTSTWRNSLPFHLFQYIAAFQGGLFIHLLREIVTWLLLTWFFSLI